MLTNHFYHKPRIEIYILMSNYKASISSPLS